MSAVRVERVALLLLSVSVAVNAQEPRLVGWVPDAARPQLEAILDSARARGLPIEPLLDRAFEGAAKAAPPGSIVIAVSRLRDELLLVRSAFGEAASTAELTAGASALRAGAMPEQLAQLRKLRPGKPLTVAAGVLADLAAAGVPADTAISAVLAIARDADDADYLVFRRNVQRDIELGASPGAALAVRLRGLTERGSGDVTATPGTPPPPAVPPKRKP